MWRQLQKSEPEAPKSEYKEKVAQENLDAAKALATELETKQVVVKIKAGEGGRTFGSVSSKEIATACKEQHGIEIDKKKIQLPSLKNFGSYEGDSKASSRCGNKTDGESYGGVDDPMPAMDENVIKRIMPHSLEAEQSVIGSMFVIRRPLLPRRNRSRERISTTVSTRLYLTPS